MVGDKKPPIGIFMCNFIKYLVFKFKITRIFGSYYLEKKKNNRSQQKQELQFIKIDNIIKIN